MEITLTKGKQVQYYPKNHPELTKNATVFEITHNRLNLKDDDFKENTWSVSIHKSNLHRYTFLEI